MMFHFYSHCIIWHTPENYVLFKALATGSSQEVKGKKRSYCSFGVILIYNFNIIKDIIK